jgi:hypothetical protein
MGNPGLTPSAGRLLIYDVAKDRNELSPSEADALAEVSEIVAWYSSGMEGGRGVPNHTGDKDIIEAIEKAVREAKG